jgi:hypothetical protein
MASISSTFTAVGVSAPLVCEVDKLSITISGTFVASVILERAVGLNASWERIDEVTAGTTSYAVGPGTYRLRCDRFKSGTVTYSGASEDRPKATIRPVQRVTPLTAATVTATTGVDALVLLIAPAGTIAALTVVFPTNPVDGQNFVIRCSQIVTTLTVTGTVVGSPTALTVGYYRIFMWDATGATWL